MSEYLFVRKRTIKLLEAYFRVWSMSQFTFPRTTFVRLTTAIQTIGETKFKSFSLLFSFQFKEIPESTREAKSI